MGDKDSINALTKQVIEQQSYLSDDLIIEEILTRLPVKSLLRFKSVSKQWYSTLSSPNFANAHLIKSPFSPPSAPVNTLFIKCDEDCYFFSYDDDDQISGNFEDNLVKLDVDFGDQYYNTDLTGSCNGLICLTPIYGAYFIIWNPATRKLHNYGSHECSKRFVTDDSFVAHGFGYVSSTADYKFVRIWSGVWESQRTNIVHVFSLRENKWREVKFGHDYLYFKVRAVLINEKLYWRADNSIVSFDLEVERFDILKLNLGYFDCIGVMGGALSKCSCCRRNRRDISIHILESSTVVKSIGLPKESKLDRLSEMIGFTRTGKFFVTGPVNDDPRLVRWGPDLRAMLGLVDTSTKPMLYLTIVKFNEPINIARPLSLFPGTHQDWQVFHHHERFRASTSTDGSAVLKTTRDEIVFSGNDQSVQQLKEEINLGEINLGLLIDYGDEVEGGNQFGEINLGFLIDQGDEDIVCCFCF